MAAGPQPGPRVAVPPEPLASAPAGRHHEGQAAWSQENPMGRARLGFGERGPASTPASAEKASAPALRGKMVHPQTHPCSAPAR